MTNQHVNKQVVKISHKQHGSFVIKPFKPFLRIDLIINSAITDNQALICLASNQDDLTNRWQFLLNFINSALANTHCIFHYSLQNHYWNNNCNHYYPWSSLVDLQRKTVVGMSCFVREIGWIISQVSSYTQIKGSNGITTWWHRCLLKG